MSNFQNTTLATLQARLLERYESQAFWTADQARRAINEALRIYSLLTGSWRTSVNLNTIPFDPYLAISLSMTKSTRVSMSGRRLIPTSLYGLDFGVHGWEGANTSSGGEHPTQVVYWAPVSLTVIALYPAATAILPITIDGVRSTPILVNAGDFLDLGDEEINNILAYALHVLSFAKGITFVQRTRPHYIKFLQGAASKNQVFAASSLYRKLIGRDFTRYAKPIQIATLPPEPPIPILPSTTGVGT